MGLDIENGALGAEYEQIKKVRFFPRIYRNWVQNITMMRAKIYTPLGNYTPLILELRSEIKSSAEVSNSISLVMIEQN